MTLEEGLLNTSFNKKRTAPTVRINNSLHTYIVLELSKRGLSQAIVARMCGCSAQFINMIITGRKTSSEIQKRLALVLGYKSWNHLAWAAMRFQAAIDKEFSIIGEELNG